MSETTYTLDEARQVMREAECEYGGHGPSVQIREWAVPISTYLCECGRYRYDATQLRPSFESEHRP